MFSEEYRSQLKEENPDLSPTELMRLIAEQYRQLDESRKESYVSRSKLESEKWRQEIKRYAEALTETEKRQIQEYYHKKKEEYQRKQQRLENQAQRADLPARSLSAYSFFIKDFVSVHKADFDQPQEVMRAAALKWNELTEDEKKPFVDKATADRVRYEHEMAKYTSKAPPKRPANAYGLFLKEKMSGNKALTMKQVAEQWKNLTEEDKKVYRDWALDKKQQYEIAKAKYDSV
jgi:translation initiation factor 2B subunit (eIF-2B alpha/beta/delta family)